MKTIYVLLLFIVPLLSYAQADSVKWAKTTIADKPILQKTSINVPIHRHELGSEIGLNGMTFKPKLHPTIYDNSPTQGKKWHLLYRFTFTPKGKWGFGTGLGLTMVEYRIRSYNFLDHPTLGVSEEESNDLPFSASTILVKKVIINRIGLLLPLHVEHTISSPTETTKGLRLRMGINNRFYLGNTYRLKAYESPGISSVISTIFSFDDGERLNLRNTAAQHAGRAFYEIKNYNYSTDLFLNLDVTRISKHGKRRTFTFGFDGALRPGSQLIDLQLGFSLGMYRQF